MSPARRLLVLSVLAVLAAAWWWGGRDGAEPSPVDTPVAGAGAVEREAPGEPGRRRRRPRPTSGADDDAPVADSESEPGTSRATPLNLAVLRMRQANELEREYEAVAKIEAALVEAGAVSEIDQTVTEVDRKLNGLWRADAALRARLILEVEDSARRIGDRQAALRDSGLVSGADSARALLVAGTIGRVANWFDSPLAGPGAAKTAEAVKREGAPPLGPGMLMGAYSKQGVTHQAIRAIARRYAAERLRLLDARLADADDLPVGRRVAFGIRRVIARAEADLMSWQDARIQASDLRAAAAAGFTTADHRAVDGLVALIEWYASPVRESTPRR